MKADFSSAMSLPSLFCSSALGRAFCILTAFGAFVSPAFGATVAYVSLPTATNSSATILTNPAYTSNLGYAFKTGSSGAYDIDWVNLQLTSSQASGSTGTFMIAIHGTDNETAYSAVPSSTAYATDTVNFTSLGPGQNFLLELTSADIPNISSYSLQANTAYSLFLYNASTSNAIALRRLTGLANGTTNDEYDVTNGFTMLDTFRNNTPNYTNGTGSYPALSISFGTTVAVPEPSVLALFSIFLGGGLLRRHRKSFF
jgi:hypothetical protein